MPELQQCILWVTHMPLKILNAVTTSCNLLQSYSLAHSHTCGSLLGLATETPYTMVCEVRQTLSLFVMQALDFPLLVNDGGKLLEQELGVSACRLLQGRHRGCIFVCIDHCVHWIIGTLEHGQVWRHLKLLRTKSPKPNGLTLHIVLRLLTFCHCY